MFFPVQQFDQDVDRRDGSFRLLPGCAQFPGNLREILFLNAEIIKGAQHVLQFLQLPDENMNFLPGKQAGEELQEVSQLLAMYTQSVQHLVFGVLENQVAFLYDATVFPVDFFSCEVPDRGIGIGCIRRSLMKILKIFIPSI